MKHIVMIVLLLAAVMPGTAIAQGDGDCDPAAVQNWIAQRQALRNASQQVLDSQGVSAATALMQLTDHLQEIEDLSRPACADAAMLWTYYLYTNLQHLLICAQNGDKDCVQEIQGRLQNYRERDTQIMQALAAGAGLPDDALKPPTPTPAPQTQRLGPIHDTLYDETFSVEIALNGFRFSQGSAFLQPKSGYVYVIVDLTIRNQGPGALRSIGPFNFQVRDANGAVRDYTFAAETSDCDLDMVDLPAGGSVTGCVAFEVPDTGSLELIYAPYQYEGLTAGRFLSFKLR